MSAESIRHRGITIYRHRRRWRFTWRPKNQWVIRDTPEAAIAELNRMLDEKERSRTAALMQGLSVSQLLEEWWSRKQREVRESTQMRYESVMRLHVVPGIGHLAANEVRPLDIEDYHSAVTYKTALISRDVLRPAFQWGMAEQARHPTRRRESNERRQDRSLAMSWR